MFDSLDEQIRIDEHKAVSKRMMRRALILLLTIIVFGGLYRFFHAEGILAARVGQIYCNT